MNTDTNLLRSALSDLLAHPWPSVLIDIRRTVREQFGEDEKAASEQLETYCTEEFCLQGIQEHMAALRKARAALEATETHA